MVKKIVLLAALVSGVAAISSARALYRIDVKGSAPVLSRDQPVSRGSVVLFHRHPDGRLTSLPQEMVAGIVPATGSVRAASTTIRRRGAADRAPVTASAVQADPNRPLAPGEAVLLGSTGGGSTNPAGQMASPGPSSAQAVAGRAAVEAQVFPGDLPAPSGMAGSGTNPNGYPAGVAAGQTVINPTLAGTTTSATAPNTPIGSNGFPTATMTGPQTGTNPINPNGFPATTTTGAQSGTNPINPNGFPATTTTGPQSGTNPINPNGFPATTSTGPQGGTPAINPNGFPATTQPAQTNGTGTSRQSTTGSRSSSSRAATTNGNVTLVPATGSSPAVVSNTAGTSSAMSTGSLPNGTGTTGTASKSNGTAAPAGTAAPTANGTKETGTGTAAPAAGAPANTNGASAPAAPAAPAAKPSGGKQ